MLWIDFYEVLFQLFFLIQIYLMDLVNNLDEKNIN